MPTGETLAAGTQSSEPQPPPTPTATASSSPSSTTRHRRHRTFSSSSSSSSSLSAASSPSPSPRSRAAATTTSVPFAWEHHPGIPKTRLAGTPSSSSASAPTPLPLPPPLRAPTTPSSRPRHHHHHARRRRTGGKPRPADDAAADPFAAALAQCTREHGGDAGAGPDDDAGLMDALFPARAAPAPTSRRWSSLASAGAVVGLLDLYGCRSAMGGGGVAEAAFVVRRPVAVGRAGARAGRR